MAGHQGQGRGRSNSLPAAVVDYLRAWLLHPDHIHHPYPTEQEKAKMIADTGIDMKRLNNWFVNSRIRIWKPKYEALMKQQKMQGKQSPQVPVATTPSTNPPSPRSACEETCLPSIETTFESKSTTAIVPRRVSLVPPSPPIKKMLHEISDASLHPSDTSSCSSSDSSSTVFESKSEEGSLSSLKRPSVDIVAFATPSRFQKRPRIVSEGSDLATRYSSSLSSNRYAEENVEEWKQACLRSPRLDDQSLPTFDEATCLFGYSVVA
ncbi:homeobox KN domain containing protein [Nitzschia inconspicua]|uniref:Homeobox KN domain containing protein n=1 Tax=Nitzschia inconspicua TaxID=303405 RepID=A0A9K3PUE6_9STRA|nr:homeobox KN domain containing protein [Nitzschia inconspicua]